MIRKIIFSFIFLFSQLAFANSATDELKQKLQALSGFSAEFAQQVTDINGQVVQSATGYVELIQPDKFKWVTAEPNENTLQSDGETVWFYDPFVEQVTATWLKDTLQSNPVLLLLKPDSDAWQAYLIKQNSDSEYVIMTTDQQAHVAQIKIKLASGNKLTELSILDKQGQTSVYSFTQFSPKTEQDFRADYFKFSLPEGVELDDQRR